ncbi:tim barrel metal-dependent [Colletotrichum karsti]|uniref:Tim barrel metal-dependent n=1 Tax=Colletotrichum karsti TaxID=1095194 RepID=A0A9P6I6A3_9PEZI|nr:tim barrel metal-dependent [Colletotrichum karsti]KAF9876789.1 tim barrel metal-dependent [Colletotrichum karsti]
MSSVNIAPKPVPAGAWDTHLHIFEPGRFAFASGRHFTPSVATLGQLLDFEDFIGVSHVCIAHGLSYGADCSSLLYYLEHFNGTARGICVLDLETVTYDLLDKYHNAGIRSVRLDFFKAQAMNDVNKQVNLIEATANRLLQWHQSGKGWSIQIQQPNISHWKQLGAVIQRSKVPVVLDHIGLVKASSMAPEGSVPVTQLSGWNDLLDTLRSGNLWIKISAPYRCSRADPDFDDLKDIVQQLVQTNSKRLVWGSDWPHTQRHEDRHLRSKDEQEPFLKIDDRAWIRSLSTWFSGEEWQDLWVNNPSTLYDFPAKS